MLSKIRIYIRMEIADSSFANNEGGEAGREKPIQSDKVHLITELVGQCPLTLSTFCYANF